MSHGAKPWRAQMTAPRRRRSRPSPCDARVRAAHVRTDQEPGQAHRPVQVVQARRRIPTDPAAPRRTLQGRRRRSDRAGPAVFGPQQIPYLPADQWPGDLRMLVLHLSMPDRTVRRIRDHNRSETLDLTDLRRNVPCRCHRQRPAPPDTGSTRCSSAPRRCSSLGIPILRKLAASACAFVVQGAGISNVDPFSATACRLVPACPLLKIGPAGKTGAP